MKNAVFAFAAVSLGLNAVLLVTLLAGRGTEPPPAPIAAAPAPARPAKPVVDAETWPTLHTDDLPALVQRLRARGFPPEVVRAILTAQLRETFAAREKALDPGQENRPYWKQYSLDPRLQTARMQLYREQQKKLRELLGTEADLQENVNALYQGRRFDSLPPEKVADVQLLLQQFNDARNDIFANFSGGMIGAETQKKIQALEKDQQAALANLLTPQEFEEWNLRNSDTARGLRSELSAFEPTEAEFRSLYKLRAAFDEQFGRLYAPPSQEDMQRRHEAQQQLNAQIKSTLGPVRAAEYERASDYNYRQTSQLVARLELPSATTNQIYDVQKDIAAKIMSLYQSGTPAADRDKQLQQLAGETETRITALLGARGFEAYKQFGGSWMQQMRPGPPRPR